MGHVYRLSIITQYFIKPEDVRNIKKSIYRPIIGEIEDFLKPEYSKTLDSQQFLQVLHLYPSFLFLYSSEYQLNIFRKYAFLDQLYVDGTISIDNNSYEICDYYQLWSELSNLVADKLLFITCGRIERNIKK